MSVDKSPFHRFTGIALVAFASLFFSPWAQAVPSFARQTGLQCFACHTVFPQLTPFGRQFKLGGYTMTDSTKGQTRTLQENWLPPLSLMLQISETLLAKKQPDTLNGNVQFPDQLSLFYAGRMADKAGAFMQITYDGIEDHFSLDNTDVRFASKEKLWGKEFTYGVTLNNNPTVQDPWNSTPAWGYPYASSGIAPAPIAATLVDGKLAQQVAGLGAYAFWDRSLYAELAFYRASQIGQPQPPGVDTANLNTNTVDGNAPYWRLAYEYGWDEKQFFEIGTYGLSADLLPEGATGPTDKYRDVAADAQYQYLSDGSTLTLHAALITEKQTLDATFPAGAANGSNNLQTVRSDLTYYSRRKYGGTLGYFSTTGDSDPLLYAANPVTGSRTGKPDTRGWIAELDYLPWQNTKFAVQYTRYDKFNGAGSNYDGSGRDASDNDTVYLNSWLNW